MTYEEALNEITDECRSCCGDGCKDCRTHYVKEALEKQIPKKPAKQWGNNVCPNCRTDTHCRTVMGWEKHCPDCGQAIDWSDEE